MPNGVGADGGEEAQEDHVFVQPRVHAELLDATLDQVKSSLKTVLGTPQ